MRVIRWGIVGVGVVSDDFVQGLSHAPGSEVAAVWSRTRTRTDDFARRHQARAVGSLDELLKQELDVVYVASPPALHREHAIACLDAGKAVLVEKPFATSGDEARAIVNAAKRAQRFCMEAMWMRFVPAARELVTQLRHGRWGKVKSIEASLGFNQANARDGALLDLGVYPLSFVQAVLGAPRAARAVGSHDEASLVLEFDMGAQASVRCSARAQLRNDAMVWAEGATVHLEAPLFRPESFVVQSAPEPAVPEPTVHRGGLRSITRRPELRRWVQRAKAIAQPRTTLPALGSGYAHEAIEVNDAVRSGALESAVLPLEETLAVMQTVDEVRRSLER